MTLTQANDGEAIQIRQDDAIELRLQENATTGFRWSLVRSDGLVEESVAGDASPQPVTDHPPQMGAGGIRLFRFRARTTGTGRVELKLWREFEGESSVLKRFGLDITIVG